MTAFWYLVWFALIAIIGCVLGCCWLVRRLTALIVGRFGRRARAARALAAEDLAVCQAIRDLGVYDPRRTP